MQLLLLLSVIAFAAAGRISERDCRLQCQEAFVSQRERFACTKGCNTGANDIDCYDTKVGCPIVTASNQFICYAACNLAKDACQTPTCQNGGVCSSSIGADGLPAATCECPEGFIGELCEVSDPCALITCQNEGECVSNQDGSFAECVCPEGFSGADCSEVLDACTPNPCLLAAACTLDDASVHGYSCDCPAGAQGVACDVEVPDFDECDPNPCVNGGTCTVGGVVDGVSYEYGTYTCECVDDFVGPTCADVNPCVASTCDATGSAACSFAYDETDTIQQVCECNEFYSGDLCEELDVCAQLSPCENEGECTNDAANPLGYVCDCTSNWLGTNCNLDVNECALTGAADKCVNGECENTPGNYNCFCQIGWAGAHCNSDIDECLTADFCANSGTCTNTIGGFSCECPADFTGARCETKIDDCPAEKVCKHGGVCVDGVASYSCQCAAGWSGPDCNRKTGKWVEWKDAAYLDVPFPRLSYANAQAACELANSELVSIQSENENAFVAALAKQSNTHPRWIGGKRVYNPAGTVQSNLVNFVWEDSTPLAFTNFFRGEPNNVGGNEDCLSQGHSELGYGKWNDANCEEQRRYVCKKLIKKAKK